MPEHQEKFHDIISYILESYIASCQKKIAHAMKDTETGRLISTKEYAITAIWRLMDFRGDELLDPLFRKMLQAEKASQDSSLDTTYRITESSTAVSTIVSAYVSMYQDDLVEEQKTFETEEIVAEEAYYRGQLPGSQAILSKDNLFFRSDRPRQINSENEDESEVVTSVSGEGSAKRLIVLLANMHDSMVWKSLHYAFIKLGLVVEEARPYELAS